jgi:exodeoxyribonuclease III
VAGRVAAQSEQARALAAGDWDLVCLQEVTPTTIRAWRAALRDLGTPAVWSSLDDWTPGDRPPAGRRLGVVTAGRTGLDVIDTADVPWPERLLSVRCEGPFELHNLHSPISQKPGHVKLRTHRALHAYLRAGLDRPQVLAGDLNTPRRELPDGTTWSFARDSRGQLRLDRGSEWEASELALLRGLEPYGFRDVFRELHGYERREISWSYPRRRGGYRLDHVLASRHFDVLACEYLEATRDPHLSDHTAVWAELALREDEGG